MSGPSTRESFPLDAIPNTDVKAPRAGTVLVVALWLSNGAGAAAELPDGDGFESGSLAGFWADGSYGSGRYEPGAIVVSDTPARSGTFSARVTVESGDISQDAGDGKKTDRAELDSGKFALLNHAVWYGFSFLLARGFPIVDNRLVLAQWKQDTVENPLIAQRFRDGKHYVTINIPVSLTSDGKEKYRLPPIEIGAWNDMAYRVRYSAGEEGLVEIWMNGERVVLHEGPTEVKEGPDRFYNKIGLYRDRWPEPMTAYFDNYAIGASFADVDPARRFGPR